MWEIYHSFLGLVFRVRFLGFVFRVRFLGLRFFLTSDSLKKRTKKWTQKTKPKNHFYLRFLLFLPLFFCFLPLFLEAVLEAVRQKYDCVFFKPNHSNKTEIVFFFFMIDYTPPNLICSSIFDREVVRTHSAMLPIIMVQFSLTLFLFTHWTLAIF